MMTDIINELKKHKDMLALVVIMAIIMALMILVYYGSSYNHSESGIEFNFNGQLDDSIYTVKVKANTNYKFVTHNEVLMAINKYILPTRIAGIRLNNFLSDLTPINKGWQVQPHQMVTVITPNGMAYDLPQPEQILHIQKDGAINISLHVPKLNIKSMPGLLFVSVTNNGNTYKQAPLIINMYEVDDVLSDELKPQQLQNVEEPLPLSLSLIQEQAMEIKGDETIAEPTSEASNSVINNASELWSLTKNMFTP